MSNKNKVPEGVPGQENKKETKITKITKILEILFGNTSKEINNILDHKTEIRQLLEQINLSEYLLDTVPVPVFAKDLDGNFLTCNKSFLEFSNIDNKDEIYLKKGSYMFSKKDSLYFEEKNKEFLNSGKETDEYEYKLEDGRYVHIKYNCIKSQEGEVKGIMGVVTDMSLYKKRLNILEGNNSVVIHEIKTPLNGIQCPIDLLKLTPLNEEQKELIWIMETSLNTLMDIIELSRILVRLEMGTYKIDLSDFDFGDIVNEGNRSLVLSESIPNINVIYLYNGGILSYEKINDIIFNGDKDLIKIMYFNLLKNAIEATGKDGPVIITINDKDGLEINISNGGNIPEEIRDNFWDKYVTKGKHNGTGFGTYIIKQVVDLHGGSVSFRTGTGTTEINLKLPNKKPL